jgi:hypothetical protein
VSTETTDPGRYSAEDRTPGFTGRRFESLGGGGDHAVTRDLITAEDLVAVQMLSVHVPADVAIDLPAS